MSHDHFHGSESMRTILIACFVIAGCTAKRDAATDSRSADTAFATLQQRGTSVMGVDQGTSKHVFEDLADGGRIVLDGDDPADTAAVARIRAHMRDVASDFTKGNFSKPFAVHAMTVPGSAVMGARSRSIKYSVIDRPRGAEVRIFSADPAAVAAIHSFLAFQRSDHRAAGHEPAGR
jgi:hypothetical protein